MSEVEDENNMTPSLFRVTEKVKGFSVKLTAYLSESVEDEEDKIGTIVSGICQRLSLLASVIRTLTESLSANEILMLKYWISAPRLSVEGLIDVRSPVSPSLDTE